MNADKKTLETALVNAQKALAVERDRAEKFKRGLELIRDLNDGCNYGSAKGGCDI